MRSVSSPSVRRSALRGSALVVPCIPKAREVSVAKRGPVSRMQSSLPRQASAGAAGPVQAPVIAPRRSCQAPTQRHIHNRSAHVAQVGRVFTQYDVYTDTGYVRFEPRAPLLEARPSGDFSKKKSGYVRLTFARAVPSGGPQRAYDKTPEGKMGLQLNTEELMQIYDWDPMSQPPLLFTRTNALTGEGPNVGVPRNRVFEFTRSVDPRVVHAIARDLTTNPPRGIALDIPLFKFKVIQRLCGYCIPHLEAFDLYFETRELPALAGYPAGDPGVEYEPM